MCQLQCDVSHIVRTCVWVGEPCAVQWRIFTLASAHYLHGNSNRFCQNSLHGTSPLELESAELR